MKIIIGVQSDEGQSVTVQTRENVTGADGVSKSLGPGQQGLFDMPDGWSIVLIHGAVHFDNGQREPRLVPEEPQVRGEAVTEQRSVLEDVGKMDEPPALVPADPARVAAVASEAVANGAETTADGKITVGALNTALADAGHEPVTAAERDEAHLTNTADI